MILLRNGKLEETPDFTHVIEEVMKVQKPMSFNQYKWQDIEMNDIETDEHRGKIKEAFSMYEPIIARPAFPGVIIPPIKLGKYGMP